MNYKNCTIQRTDMTTNVVAWFCGKERTLTRKVYAIEGDVSKPAGMRPFLTSIQAAKDYISERLD